VHTPALAVTAGQPPTIRVSVATGPPMLAVITQPVASAAVPLVVAAAAVALLTVRLPLVRMAPITNRNEARAHLHGHFAFRTLLIFWWHRDTTVLDSVLARP
jgi:hypothetical protein